ncbi:hypothetical protein GCM10009647_012460 [Streptomyces sanglieri]
MSEPSLCDPLCDPRCDPFGEETFTAVRRHYDLTGLDPDTHTATPGGADAVRRRQDVDFTGSPRDRTGRVGCQEPERPALRPSSRAP